MAAAEAAAAAADHDDCAAITELIHAFEQDSDDASQPLDPTAHASHSQSCTVANEGTPLPLASGASGAQPVRSHAYHSASTSCTTAEAARLLPSFAQHAPKAPAVARKLPRQFAQGRAPLPSLELPKGVATIYTRSEGECDELCSMLLGEVDAGRLDLVGFDLEWKVTYEAGQVQRPVALVQLATASVVHIFHISAMARFPEKLARLVEDARLLKAGSKLVNDMYKLRRDFGLRASGVLEHQRLAEACLPYGQRPWHLSELCETVLQRHMSKDGSLRTSNWEARKLDHDQLRYAALDAWASRAVAIELLRRIRLTGNKRVLMTDKSTDQMQSGEQQRISLVELPGKSFSIALVASIEEDPMWCRRARGREWLLRRSHGEIDPTFSVDSKSA
mmetsp:Transcript_27571/g.70265  ORF Transcript_27571/g.70265 Transcript_27571/m.70265 type:complete len:391 (+) Transcript_27571:27-1199(+)